MRMQQPVAAPTPLETPPAGTMTETPGEAGLIRLETKHGATILVIQ